MATILDAPAATSETPTLARLLDMTAERGVIGAWSIPHAELDALQLQAAQEVFAQRRRQIRILDKRATEAGIERIESFEDIVPLLFSHSTYKSYPMSFITDGKWDKLLRWYGTLVASPVDNVDLSDVTDLDSFVAALWRAGHKAVVTNGTTGKVSLLERTETDDVLLERTQREAHCWPNPAKPERTRHLFLFSPRSGPYIMFIGVEMLAELYCRPDSLHYLSDEPLSVTGVMRNAERRNKLKEGTATPNEVASWEEEARETGLRMKQRADEMIEKIIKLRHEPLMIGGPWAQIWNLMQRARELGVKDGEFHPETMLIAGGGTKGADLPPDYRDQIMQFLGPVRQNLSYSMSECSGQMYRCEAGNYHTNPWILPLVLDATGETMLPREGVVEGRWACVDMGFSGRWGGLITGDKVTMDFTDSCGCGRPGSVVLPNIARYSDLGEEDKIGCAGTIDGYIRGVMAE